MKHVTSFVKIMVLISSFLLTSVSTHADEIILKNGDRITGSVKKMEDGVLTMETEYSGPVEIQTGEIKEISTASPVEVHLTGGDVLNGKLATVPDGRLRIESGEGREDVLVDMNSVSAVNPPSLPVMWKGSINISSGFKSGNTDTASASAGAEAGRKTEKERFGLRFLYNYSEEDDQTTARSAYALLKYDYFVSKKLFGYLGIEFLNDKFRDLNLRTVIGPGAGYQVRDDEDSFLLVEGGISYFSEDLREGEDEQWVTARLASDFTYNIVNAVDFTDYFVIYPALEDAGEYQLRNEAVLTSPFGSSWSLRLAGILERDSDPSPGVEKNDWQWLLGLQYAFEL